MLSVLNANQKRGGNMARVAELVDARRREQGHVPWQ